MKADKEIYVLYGDRTVGTLAMASSYKVAFEYSDEWLDSGFAISPFSLPLKNNNYDNLDELAKQCQKILNTEYSDKLTAAALLEIDYEQPNLDYNQLMKLTKIITRENPYDIENMYRRMCFNVYAHNRDDHSKNFTYIYDEDKDGD